MQNLSAQRTVYYFRYMRKIVIITVISFLTLAFSACLSGAGGQPEDIAFTHSDIDFDNRFGNGFGGIVETEDAYYCLSFGGEYLYYYDKQSGERGVLCGKPDCLHDAEGSNRSCNGFAGSSGTSLNCADGRLYWIAEDTANHCYAVYSAALDGSQKALVTDIEEGRLTEGFTPHRADLHHGSFYAFDQTPIIINGVPYIETSIVCIDSKTGRTKIIYAADEEQSESTFQTPILFYSGQYVYFCLSKLDADADGSQHSIIELRRYDTDTEEIKDVYISREEDAPGNAFRFWIGAEDQIYLIPIAVPDGAPPKLYLLSENGLTPVFAFGRSGTSFLSDGIAVCYDQMGSKIEIRDFTGALLFDGELDISGVHDTVGDASYFPYVASIYGNRNELFVWYLLWNAETEPQSCFVRYDLTQTEPAAAIITYISGA